VTAPLELHRGDSAEWEFPVLKADGTAQDITGCSFRFTVKGRVDDLDDDAVISATTANGKCVITNAAAGLMEVRLVPADTDALAVYPPTVLLWDLQVRDAASKVWTVASGKLLVRPDISRTAP
jgi:hypothetical protein